MNARIWADELRGMLVQRYLFGFIYFYLYNVHLSVLVFRNWLVYFTVFFCVWFQVSGNVRHGVLFVFVLLVSERKKEYL